MDEIYQSSFTGEQIDAAIRMILGGSSEYSVTVEILDGVLYVRNISPGGEAT